MSTPDVLFALTGDVRTNSRALKQLRVLVGLGLSVEVLTFGPPAGDEGPIPGVRLHVLEQPEGSGPAFFRAVDRRYREAALETPAHVYHASDLYVLPGLHAAARRHGGRLVYDARELYTHVASTAGRPWVRLAWRLVEGRHIRAADAVLTVSQSIADRLASRYGIDPPVVLYNVPEHQAVTPSTYLRDATGAPPDLPILLHQGSVQKDRGCFLLADAMRDVPDALLVFLGGGPLKPVLEKHVEAHGLGDRVRLLDPVPPDALLPITASADVGITLLEDTCLNHRFALPNKLFEYLMAGLPVLASDLLEIRRVVVGHDVGLVVDPTDRTALVATLRQMSTDKDAWARWAAGAKTVFETFSWERASHRLRYIYKDLIA